MASDGDTVLVAPGTYNETIDFEDKAIRVASTGGPAATTIDANGSGPVVTIFAGSVNTVLSGFTITGGNTARRLFSPTLSLTIRKTAAPEGGRRNYALVRERRPDYVEHHLE